MASTIQDIDGIKRALDHIEARVVEYRKLLHAMNVGQQVEGDIERIALTEAEVETIESLIRDVALRVAGKQPASSQWEPMHTYCKKNEAEKDGFAAQNFEYFRWALIWIQKSRTYLEYLAGTQLAGGEDQIAARGSSRQDSTEHASRPKYHVALSFAGEDRERVRSIAHLLVAAELSVFYDEYEQSSLWGRNLYTHLSDVYQNKAKYCLMFISKFYAKKLWTKREREAAQARAFRESIEYILPLRLDDTELPGIEPTVGYVDLRQTSDEQVVRLILEKLGNE